MRYYAGFKRQSPGAIYLAGVPAQNKYIHIDPVLIIHSCLLISVQESGAKLIVQRFVPDFYECCQSTPFHFRLKLLIAHTTIYDDQGKDDNVPSMKSRDSQGWKSRFYINILWALSQKIAAHSPCLRRLFPENITQIPAKPPDRPRNYTQKSISCG